MLESFSDGAAEFPLDDSKAVTFALSHMNCDLMHVSMPKLLRYHQQCGSDA